MLHHIEINVSNLQKTIDFWGWFLKELGYSQYQKWDKGISWKFEDTYLVFVQTEDRYMDIPYQRSRAGLNHLAFQVKSKEQVDEMTQKLKEKGMTVLYPDKHPFAGGPHHYALFTEDPDRIKVELVAGVQ